MRNWNACGTGAPVVLGPSAIRADSPAVATGAGAIDEASDVNRDAEPNGDSWPHPAKASETANADPAHTLRHPAPAPFLFRPDGEFPEVN